MTINDIDSVPAVEKRVIFGGVTEKGYRTARRLCDSWISDGHDIVWFDGWSDEPAGSRRVTPGLLVIHYGKREKNRWSNRVEQWLSTKGDRSTGRTGTLWSRAARIARKWNTATRGYGSWRTIRHDVKALESLSPTRVVYCDEHAMTAGWHAARLWPEALVIRG